MLDYALPIALAVFFAAVLLRVAFYKAPKQPDYGRDDNLADVQPSIKSSRDNITFEQIRREHGTTRKFGKRSELAAPYGKRSAVPDPIANGDLPCAGAMSAFLNDRK